MVIKLVGNPYRYEMEKLSMAFFPDRKFKVLEDGESVPEEQKNDPIITVAKYEDRISVTYLDPIDSTSAGSDEPYQETEDPELAAGRALYRTLSKVTGLSPKWGILTGVRPSKVMIRHLEEDGKEQAFSYFREKLLVSPERIELANTVAEQEKKIIDSSTDRSFSLYISIPFCPNRCSYCSFVSHSVSAPSAKKLFPAYYEKLLQEVKRTGEIAKETGLDLRSVYVGGGTPSTLSAEQIRGLLETINNSFDFSNCSEFTFEAGRPDTTTKEKLRAMKEGGVDRISINPQSMTDEILKNVGRTHTVEDIKRTFQEAREVGFTNINMDLIAGLPGDTPENFNHSLQEVLALDPESVTVHTLAYKRSSSLIPTKELFSRGKDTLAMVDTSMDLLSHNGYVPYYMYRQTRSVGNLENVGWAKPGCESKYNVFMMEECHSILACGGGAVTKLKRAGSDDIKRVFNYKYPYEYVNRFDTLMEQKQQILDFSWE